jgi:hypothetical protein
LLKCKVWVEKRVLRAFLASTAQKLPRQPQKRVLRAFLASTAQKLPRQPQKRALRNCRPNAADKLHWQELTLEFVKLDGT